MRTQARADNSVLEGWRISKSKDACSRCGRQFPPARAFYSCLVEEQADLVRRDFCADCWEQEPPAGLFCYWRTRRSAAPVKRVVDTALMLEFFDRLEQADTDRKRVLRFVLALYLMRRKELKLLETGRDSGAETLIFLRRASDSRVEVQNPGLTEEQIQETAAQLGQLLSVGL
jgi:hypothetical protein